jgi:hypothetical protein
MNVMNVSLVAASVDIKIHSCSNEYTYSVLTKRNGISLAEIELGISVVERTEVATAALARATDNGDAFIGTALWS